MGCYISRVENGFKSPSLRTVERFARALEVPLYKIFYTGSDPVRIEEKSRDPEIEDLLNEVESRGPEKVFLRRLSSLWSRTGNFEHEILFDIARRMAARVEQAGGANNTKA
jgi:transcriptional regulator with XRE-family HTH domain